jgi:hypothetical protein
MQLNFKKLTEFLYQDIAGWGRFADLGRHPLE